MKKGEIKNKINEIKKYIEDKDIDTAFQESEDLIALLYKEKQYEDIVDFDKQCNQVINFEVAYSYNEIGNREKAEELYEIILTSPGEENNTSILNNLGLIKKEKGKIKEAHKFIKKAYKLSPDNDNIKKNYNNLESQLRDQNKDKEFFESAKDNLTKENEWVFGKLKHFIDSIKQDKDFKNNKIPIPKYKYKILIGTYQEKAESLMLQWLSKGYIKDTEEKTFPHNVKIYEVNPKIDKYLDECKPKKINKKWMEGFDRLNSDTLNGIHYFEIIDKIEKINKNYKDKILRDFNELVINYILQNNKAVIVLSGSLIELIFVYICEKEKVKEISYMNNEKVITRSLYDAVLIDFIEYFKHTNKYKKNIINISDLTRIYRNLIHPGNEIKNKEELNDSKMESSFHLVLEFIEHVLK